MDSVQKSFTKKEGDQICHELNLLENELVREILPKFVTANPVAQLFDEMNILDDWHEKVAATITKINAKAKLPAELETPPNVGLSQKMGALMEIDPSDVKNYLQKLRDFIAANSSDA